MGEKQLAALRQRLTEFERRTWMPVLATTDGARQDSKFGGIPALWPGEGWPTRGNCHARMPLFAQLDGAELPAPLAAAIGDHLLQLFYCVSAERNCERVCRADLPHSRSTLLRLEPGAALTDASKHELFDGLPGRRVVSWRETFDMPEGVELEEIGGEFSDDEFKLLHDQGFPRAGEKLGGWPAWVQGPEYEKCRECGRRMDVVLQIGSNHSLPWQLGDGGVGHVMQCPDHRHELAFGWNGG